MTPNEHQNQSDSTASLHQQLKKDQPDALEGEKLLDHPDYVELQKKLTEAEEKANQYWDRLLRIQAENENLFRRTERDIANAHKYALEKFVSELLPVIDSLERSITAHPEDASGMLEGVNLTLKMFYSALEKFGIQQVNPISEPFNPEWHQAVSTQESPDTQPGTVLHVLQKGYLLNNRLIRPALVIVVKNS